MSTPMVESADELVERISKLEHHVDQLQQSLVHRGVRKRSSTLVWGLPLYDIAMGPDASRGEIRGHAVGIVAVGDVATGIVAVGGLARGLVACGGLAVGGCALGGCALGMLLAVGGAAVGGVAVGGAACGYFALGGSAIGKYVVSAAQRDAEAVQFFSQLVPGLVRNLPAPAR